MSPKLPSSFSCIHVTTPRSSPLSSYGLQSTYISTSEFDPVVYREELIRKAYLSNFPLHNDRPDYLITIGKGHKTCSTINVEVKTPEKRSSQRRMPAAFVGITCSIIALFVFMSYVYISSFVDF